MPEAITKGPLVLIILDGWGIAPDSPSNPLSVVPLPQYNFAREHGVEAHLWAHGEYVGLPNDQDGNSEAGHLNLGAGRIVKQDGVIIDEAIQDGTFFKNPAFMEAIQHAERNNAAMHLIGLLSDGESAHSTPEHVYALLNLMHHHKLQRVYVHLFADGRDSSPTEGKELYEKLREKMHPGQEVATIMGRFYGMDRNKRWERTEQAYRALVEGVGIRTEDSASVFETAYDAGISDEFIAPHVITKNSKPIATIADNDSIIYFNHRSDRARQLTKAFVQKDFQKLNPGAFVIAKPLIGLRFVAMTDFGPDLGDVLTAYPSIDITQTLPEALSKKKQIYIAETEKYAHMTYFFNGGYPNPVGGEKRVLVPSPMVDHYETVPGMSTEKITDEIVASLNSDAYDFIAANFACADMIGHTADFEAGKEAIAMIDTSIGRIIAELKKRHGALIITADHGNIEEMKNTLTGKPNTEHSKNQVPFILWCGWGLPKLRNNGVLADVAPTVLELLGVQKPKEMTGKSLLA